MKLTLLVYSPGFDRCMEPRDCHHCHDAEQCPPASVPLSTFVDTSFPDSSPWSPLKCFALPKWPFSRLTYGWVYAHVAWVFFAHRAAVVCTCGCPLWYLCICTAQWCSIGVACQFYIIWFCFWILFTPGRTVEVISSFEWFWIMSQEIVTYRLWKVNLNSGFFWMIT